MLLPPPMIRLIISVPLSWLMLCTSYEDRNLKMLKCSDRSAAFPINKWHQCTTTITTVLRPFFRDHPGELVPEENFWISWCKGRLTDVDTPTIRLGATPSGLSSAHLHHSPIFYMPDALPAAQQHRQSTEGN